MLGKLVVGEIAVGEVVTGKIELGKLRWGNDLTLFEVCAYLSIFYVFVLMMTAFFYF